MGYHDSIIDLLSYIIGKGKDYLKLIDSGNAYDKIIRNYHQFNSKGERVYRSRKRGVSHYRYSEAAWRKRNDIKSLYYEHLYPVKLVKEELKTTNGDKEQIRSILDKTEIVVLTKAEARKVDGYYKDSMPKDGRSRLEVAKIKMSKHTQDNSLFGI